jgi:HK97 family phage prohead protease
MTDQIERRVSRAVTLRVLGGAEPRIIGYAAVFDQLSEDLGGFREKIRPGAFSGAILGSDVRALWQHDPNFVLGRTTNDTLLLREDDVGLRYEIVPPDVQWARDALVTMRRGDVDQSSFAFEALQDAWEQQGGQLVRTLIEVELYDVSPVTYPAYPQTSAQVRAKVEELRRAATAPRRVPHPVVVGDKGQARARLATLRRRLELAELEFTNKR